MPKPDSARRVLVSVTDKSRLDVLALLQDAGWEFVSTGGTAKALRDLGVKVTEVSEVTKMPEVMDGRLKTLHPAIFGGILADRYNADHISHLGLVGSTLFDLVVVNLYNFEEDPSIEKIDIGGPSLIHAAAKNYQSLGVVVDPADYSRVVSEIASEGSLSVWSRFWLAKKAFDLTTAYDRAISAWFGERVRFKLLEWW